MYNSTTFCISELLRAFNCIISFYFPVSVEEVTETVTQKWCKAPWH